MVSTPCGGLLPWQGGTGHRPDLALKSNYRHLPMLAVVPVGCISHWSACAQALTTPHSPSARILAARRNVGAALALADARDESSLGTLVCDLM